MNPVPYMETLQRIAAGMGPQRGFQSSLNSLLSLLTERHGFLRPHLVIFDPETRTLRLCVADGAPRSAQVVYEPGMGVTGQVFVTGKPVIVECLKGHPVFLSKFFMRTDEELSSLAFLSVPVLAPQTLADNGKANIILATGASQFEMLAALLQEPGIDWSKIRIFHLDEYIGQYEVGHSKTNAGRNIYTRKLAIRIYSTGSFHTHCGGTSCYRTTDIQRVSFRQKYRADSI